MRRKIKKYQCKTLPTFTTFCNALPNSVIQIHTTHSVVCDYFYMSYYNTKARNERHFILKNRIYFLRFSIFSLFVTSLNTHNHL